MRSIALAGWLVIFAPAWAANSEANPEWIWTGGSRAGPATANFRKIFDQPPELKTAELQGLGDFCELEIYLNDQPVAHIPSYSPWFRMDVTRHLKPTENVLTVRATDSAGPSAFAIRLKLATGTATNHVVTDRTWQTGSTNRWKPAITFGHVSSVRWDVSGGGTDIQAVDNYEQWKQAIGSGQGTDPATFATLPGFEIERVHSATKDEGSWVSMTFDPKGRVIIAKELKGLLRLTLPAGQRTTTKVETINDTLEECRGLLFAFDSLYANANKSKGLYRLRDTKGSDQFDEVKLLVKTEAGGHGRNDLALGPDRKIYQIAGDSVDFPGDIHKFTPPIATNLVPGERFPRGHLVRCDADGQHPELVAGGLRNPFGIDFNSEGEAFTYDADAEHDMGAPWYRPTRIRHLVSGADFGWRRVTGSWPPYYPDHVDEPPLTLDIGKGSPTAVKFGTRSQFPPEYQRALFALDWAYGRILAVHLSPCGASYRAQAETFLRGRPLNVTDLEFGPDGAMYFITGGRNTQSALYRVRYTGKAVTEAPLCMQDRAREHYSKRARELRHYLETFHGRQDPLAVDKAWPHLASADPWIAHAARVAIEHQPWESWQSRALTEPSVYAALPALMALARVGTADLLPKIITRLNTFEIGKLSETEKLTAIRTYDICLGRGGRGDEVAEIVPRLGGLLPGPSATVNQTLAALLATLDAPGIVQKNLALLATAETQEMKLHYLYLLRGSVHGWTETDRAKYFRALAQTDSFRGGAGLPKFLEQIKAEAVAAIPEAQRGPWAEMLAPPKTAELPAAAESRPLVRAWKMEDLTGDLEEAKAGRNFERGRKVFAAAMCAGCHQLGREGRAFGPDLTEVASRFARRDILESILLPSQVVAESYRNVTVRTKGGETFSGRLALEGDYRLPVLRIAENPLAPDKVSEIAKSEVASYTESTVSPMPEGLLNSFTKDEILDLLAYLEAGGDEHHGNFRK